MSKKKISSHVLLGATLLSGVNPALVEAKTETRDSAPSIEQVVEVEDKEVIDTEIEAKYEEKLKNKKAGADTPSVNEKTVQTEAPVPSTRAALLDEWMPDPLLQELVAEQLGIAKGDITQELLADHQLIFDYGQDNRFYYLTSYKGLEFAEEVALLISAQPYNNVLFSLRDRPLPWSVLEALPNLTMAVDGDLTAIFPQGIDLTDDRIHIDPHNVYFSHDIFLNQTNYHSFTLSYAELKYLNMEEVILDENSYIGGVYFNEGYYTPKALEGGVEFTLAEPLDYATLAGRDFVNTDDQPSFPDGPYMQTCVNYKYINSRINLHFAMPGGEVTSRYLDTEGNEISTPVSYNGGVGEDYQTESKQIPGYILHDIQGQASGKFTEDPQTITYVYRKGLHEEIQIKDVTLEASPAIAWLGEHTDVKTEMFKPSVIHPLTHQELDEEALEELGFTLRYKFVNAPHLGENPVKLIMNNGSEEKEVLTVLYLGEPQVRVIDSKFIKPSEWKDMILVNRLAHSTVDVQADFGEAHPEKDGLSLEIKDFKATQYDQKNKVTLLVNLGTSSQALEAEGALNRGEEGWILSSQRHYGVVVQSPTYTLGSSEHRLASQDTLAENMKLYQATPTGRLEQSTHQAADFLALKPADLAAFKTSNKSGAHAIAFEFGKKEENLQEQREGQATLTVHLVEEPVGGGFKPLDNPQLSPANNPLTSTVTKITPPTLSKRNSTHSRQKLGEFGSREQTILGAMGTVVLLGSALLVWFKKRR